MDRFMTAQEIADSAIRLGLDCMPHTKRSVNRRAGKEFWADNTRLVRKRQGWKGGGGTEYHVSLLPQPMIDALMGEVSTEVRTEIVAESRAIEVAKREALDTTALTARQRQVMNARASVLTAIETVQVSGGHTRSHTVNMFIADPARFGVDNETIAASSNRSGDKITLHRATILRWFQYRELTGVGALAPKATKERSEIPSWFWDFLKGYARPQKPCISEAFDAFMRTDHGVNEPITYSKVRRLIDKLGNVEKHRGREGSLTLKARMAYVTRSTGDLLPTCVYTSDGKTFDAEIAHPIHGRPFRPEVTSVVDVATRKCVGFSVGLAENAEGVIDALRYACETHGIPAIFYVDRGSGFKNKRLDADLTGLMGRLGITKYHSLPQNSQARGIIERFHGTVWNKLARQYDTYVNSEMDRQARQKAFKVTRKEHREFGTSASLPSFDEFLGRCKLAVDAYNADTHSSLPGRQSPNEYWQSHVEGGFEPVLVTASESADLFRPYVKRKTRRCLIEYRTNQYFHIGLQEYDGDYVLIGYDIHDANHIWVREIDQMDGEERGGRLICIAKFAGNEQRYVPVTMERLAMEGRAKGRQRRLQDQLDEVEAELNPMGILEHNPMAPVPTFDASYAEPIMDADYERIEPALVKTNSTPKFSSDVDLARWALEHPNELQSSQIAALEACLMDFADRQLLADHGIDVDELAPIIRQAIGDENEKRRANS
jgi:putative transposase